MKATIAVRAERPADGPTISNVVLRAYTNVVYSDHREHLMIERLRGTDAWIPALSLLAEVGSEAVGHILLTRAEIHGTRSCVGTLALAPLSVVPNTKPRVWANGWWERLVSRRSSSASKLSS